MCARDGARKYEDTMTEYRKTQLTLPAEVVDAFQGLDTETRNKYVAVLRRIGWTLQSISDATGLTRERVRQIHASFEGEPSEDGTIKQEPLEVTLPTPMPPVKVKKAPRTYVEPDPVKLARLLELQPAAQKVRANSDANRAEAEEYTRLIWETHNDDGVTLYRLAKHLGLSHGALRFRLARYGYKMPESGVSKVYTRIDPTHRAI